MVIEGQSIMYRNVVWHPYKVHYSELNQALDDFNEKLVEANLTINGPLIYALHNAPLEEIMLIEIYIPVEQSCLPQHSPLKMQTYFMVDQMLMTRVKGSVATKTEFAYEELFTYAMVSDLQIASPIFHVFRGDEVLQWIEIKVKAITEENELNEHDLELLQKYARKLFDR